MQAKPPLKIVLCSPRGFCAGVVRAIDTVERALTIYGAPVYVRHDIVHNRYVVDSLKTKGAIFVEELAEIPDNTNAPVVFSAHGVPKSVPADAKRRNFFSLDATCPLVTKVHREAAIHFKRGREILLIGHSHHPEVVGTLGQLPAGAVTLIETAGLGMARMSSLLSVRKPPRFHPSVPMFRSFVPRRPASTVRATTCFSGGSDTRNAAIRQGRAGSAQQG